MKRGDVANPFAPGPGTQPPCLAGREAPQTWLREELQSMAERGVARKPIIVYAPRGHGKTVLLDSEGMGQEAAHQGVP